MKLMIALANTVLRERDNSGMNGILGKHFETLHDSHMHTQYSYTKESSFLSTSSEEEIISAIALGLADLVSLDDVFGLTIGNLEQNSMRLVSEDNDFVGSVLYRDRIRNLAIISVIVGQQRPCLKVVEKIDVPDNMIESKIEDIILERASSLVHGEANLVPQWAQEYMKQYEVAKSDHKDKQRRLAC